jgi:hypothetical protein
MENYGKSWANMETYGKAWKNSWKNMENHGTFSKLHGKILEDFEVNSSITEIPYDSAGEPRGISP